MVLFELTLSTLITALWLVSLYLIGFIVYYMSKKALGYQTVLDLVSRDSGIIGFLWLTGCYLAFMISIIAPNLDNNIKLALVIGFHIVSEFGQSTVFLSVVTKYLLIFKPSVISEISDEKFLLGFRLMVLLIAIICTIIDQVTRNGAHALMIIMTGDSNSLR